MMKTDDILKLKAAAPCATTGDGIEFRLSVFVFKDNGDYISYCPSLDITSSGSTQEEALSNFHEAFGLYIEYCLENGTLHKDLEAHGWKLGKDTVSPPSFNVLIKNQEVRKLMTHDVNFNKVVTDVRIPALA